MGNGLVSLDPALGSQVIVTFNETMTATGKLIELDGNNIVIEVLPGFETVFRRNRIKSLLPARKIRKRLLP